MNASLSEHGHTAGFDIRTEAYTPIPTYLEDGSRCHLDPTEWTDDPHEELLTSYGPGDGVMFAGFGGYLTDGARRVVSSQAGTRGRPAADAWAGGSLTLCFEWGDISAVSTDTTPAGVSGEAAREQADLPRGPYVAWGEALLTFAQ